MARILPGRYVLTVMALAIAAGFTSFANAGEAKKASIAWALAEEAPITYTQNNSFRGYGVRILDMITGQMKGFSHDYFMAGNYSRITKQVETGPRTCAVGLFRTDARLKIMHFSNAPAFFFFNIQLVMRRDTFLALGQPESLSLEHLLKQDEHVLGISQGRTYSKKLRDLFAANKGSPNIQLIAQSNVSSSLSKMVAKKRIDFTLAYPEEAAWITETDTGKTPLDLVTVPISEINPLGEAWIACTKSEEGFAAIRAINGALATERPKQSYRAQLERWFGKNLTDRFRHAYKTQFLAKRSQQPKS